MPFVALLAACAPSAPPAALPASAPVASSTPTPTSPVATGPTLRVNTTCDDLVPPAMVQQLAGKALSTVVPTGTTSPTSFGNARVGALECRWSDGGTPGFDGIALYLTVGPDVTRDGFDYYLHGESGGDAKPSTVGPDAYLMSQGGTPVGFVFLTAHYGVSAYVYKPAAVTLAPTAASTLLEHVYGIVSALPAPAPLWRPTPDLRGTTGCDGLATAGQVATTVGLDSPRVVKDDGGEYSTSLFDIDRQVGGYWCVWVSDTGSSAYASVAILPGGASFAPKARVAGSRDIAGLGDSAFVSPDGRLDVIAANGWIQLGDPGATEEQLVALARTVLQNNGYQGG
ncbi:hypothetical protein G3T36_15810 [Diaminobutyricibacter tongyongensis]|uniref:DUF3558 domain-containing protein n=1 Tax=Leifsonia tongyongensis TaxID=1268043 RepID=A0A6L9Y183_9MICO|nr:hypothetical protein [Diaminobutyricibacter tongyongensis]NEN07326.1 hypothetical protein [Diaminobutyricibacter tongyongensis]